MRTDSPRDTLRTFLRLRDSLETALLDYRAERSVDGAELISLLLALAQTHDVTSGVAVTPKAVGLALFGPYVLAVEIASMLLLAGLGVWLWLNPSLLESFGGATVAAPPPPAAGNLLEDAWSFETTADGSPDAFWVTPPGAPAGFTVTAEAAVSGAAGAQAVQSDGGWSRWESREGWRVDGRADRGTHDRS